MQAYYAMWCKYTHTEAINTTVISALPEQPYLDHFAICFLKKFILNSLLLLECLWELIYALSRIFCCKTISYVWQMMVAVHVCEVVAAWAGDHLWQHLNFVLSCVEMCAGL